MNTQTAKAAHLVSDSYRESIEYDFLNTRLENNLHTVAASVETTAKMADMLAALIQLECTIVQTDTHGGFAMCGEAAMIQFSAGKWSSEVKIFGDTLVVEKLQKSLESQFPSNPCFIKWVYDPQHMEYMTVPVHNGNQPMQEMYPFLEDESLASYYDRYLNSSANILVLIGAPGCGKCLGKGTPVLMFDGSVKAVEDVQVGDLLMGDDSTPRTVLTLARGREQMYKIKQKKGDDYIVNESHIISLKQRRLNHKKVRTHAERFQDISVRDYLQRSNAFKGSWFGYKVPVEFQEKEVLLDPYFVGLWLGDGTSAEPAVTTADEETLTFLSEYATSLGLTITPRNSKTSGKSDTYYIGGAWVTENTVMSGLRHYNLLNNKHIPTDYKVNSRSVRLAVLAGLLDSDGYLDHSGIGFEFSSSREGLADDVVFLARSLGFQVTKRSKSTAATVGGPKFHSWVVAISGHTDTIPTKIARKQASPRKQIKDPLHTSIDVEKLEVDDYYGFEIDGNKRFLLGDFTVTHNTTFIRGLLAHTKKSATLTYHQRILEQDSFFVQWIEGNDTFMILEDSDTLLLPRAEGNDMMARFLNLGDGLMSFTGKKIIFSTNIPNISDIDDALLRPGRCFDVIEFSALNRPQAEQLAAKAGVPLPDGNSFTVGEVFAATKNEVSPASRNKRFGFV